ncbi:MAG: ATP-dependent DNA helicase [Burkholderiaceae bacterium]
MNYAVAVRELCEFTAKRGDLDLRFTPSPTGLEGMEGHAAVRARRPPSYQAEIALSREYRNLLVRGRADGYDPDLNQLEEIKTHRGPLDAMPANHRALHWAQAKVYAHLQCRALNLPEMRVALVYFDITRRSETVLVENCRAETLQAHFEQLCELYAEWAEQELQHRERRDQALEGLAFPHAGFRPGQRQLAVTIYKAAMQERHLLAQAPTGIGKTVGALFPMLKSCPRNKLDKVFFLTAKTSGRQLALDALKIMGDSATTDATPFLRVLELTAKEKACEHPDKACHGASCPLAQGFYDKLPAARRDALQAAWMDKAGLRKTAAGHGICPYWLGMELAQWSDVVVGDYNYYFDVSATLHGLTEARQWRVGVLVDEAHNLLERARAMYSAELSQARLRDLRRNAPAALKRALGSLFRQYSDTWRDQEDTYQAYTGLPQKFLAALLRTSAALSDHFVDHPEDAAGALQGLHFDILHFLRMAESFGGHSIFDITLAGASKAGDGDTNHPAPQDAVFCIRNLIPAPFLEQRHAASRGSVLFSATLNPWTFYRDTLGLPEDTAWVDVESPFRPDQLQVRIAADISTRYAQRARSLAPIARLMQAQYEQRPGNYLSYFSSFDYMQQAADTFARLCPDIPAWRQSRGMNESDREGFLERFAQDGQGIGFAVLGGAFSEGIDLPGSRLIGAFISTLGLPQINPVNEQMKQCMGKAFGTRHGYDYAYLYPGIQKVIQAAGRVIRGHDDQGVVHLIDDRYGQLRIQALLPSWWRVEYGNDNASPRGQHP